MTVRESIAAALEAAAREIGAEGELPDLELARARNPDHGDFASSAGMKLARLLRRPPGQIAGELAAAVRLPGAEATAEAAGGYVNFRLTRQWLQRRVGEIVTAGAGYGRSDLGAGEKVQVEFGSTNPTGPLHVGHGRGYILGDALASLLAFTGHQVEREFYVNDQNTQSIKFGLSILARHRGEDPPEGGYQGDYVRELAEAAKSQGIPATEEDLRRFGVQQVVLGFERELARLGIHYDRWFRESEVWASGLGEQAIERLQKAGYLVEREGALWFAPAIADDSAPEDERVVRRSSGEYTYFASDLGYLLSRFEQRGFHRVIEVWGSDHHGYVPRMKSAAQALGIDPDRLVIILNQLVILSEGKMSKRAGRMVTLSELIDRVGPDAVRWFYLSRTADTQMEFDLELATTRNRTNPVFYVQYAHARLRGIERTAAGRSLPAAADLELLQQPWELDLARQLAQWPDAVAEAARLREPHRTTYFLYEVADRVSTFYEAGNDNGDFRVVVDDPRLTRARLELCRAAQATLQSGLDLLGVAAPDRMDRMED